MIKEIEGLKAENQRLKDNRDKLMVEMQELAKSRGYRIQIEII